MNQLSPIHIHQGLSIVSISLLKNQQKHLGTVERPIKSACEGRTVVECGGTRRGELAGGRARGGRCGSKEAGGWAFSVLDVDKRKESAAGEMAKAGGAQWQSGDNNDRVGQPRVHGLVAQVADAARQRASRPKGGEARAMPRA